jgi:diacylglycerol kinase (ATP)
MSKKHIVFVVNPKSGVERKKQVEHALDAYLDKEQYTYEIITTQYAKHGISIAKEAAAKGAFAVVAAGGDGSVNDVVQGLLGSGTLLGIIPMGSGNGMARTMKIPIDIAEAIKVINKGHATDVDIAYANNQAFISNAGVAFDALIAKKFAKSVKRGLIAYSWLVTKYLWRYKSWVWKINIDGREMTQRAFMVNVANGQQFGYNFKIAPMASFTDGLLDLVIIRNFPKILGGVISWRAMQGTIADSPYVTHFRGKEITISHPDLKLMQTDGDAHPCEPVVKFTVKPGAQKVLVP